MTSAAEVASEGESLPDYLRENLRVVSIGLNPSIISARAGFYFANPRNRFWRALNASGLVPEPLTPGVAAQETLFRRYGIGFTDLVKGATRGGAELRTADYREGAPLLAEKLHRHRPRIAWFHGKIAYGEFLKYTTGSTPPRIDWGMQPARIGAARAFVTPNPSPANASFSLAVLTEWYRALAQAIPPCDF
ncbi:MAG: mismatch-specific DNA-glycosylase [Gammaproteobacteria bacterium]